jgi:hypothetical protein
LSYSSRSEKNESKIAMKPSDDQGTSGVNAQDSPEWLELVRRQVASLKFGTVQIIVHDSRVTQVERVEKVRLDRPVQVQDNPKARR